jgi:excisionase family DNA binding protein
MRKRTTQAPTQPTKTPQAPLAPLLTVAEVAKLLKFSKVTIYHLMNECGLPSFKINGSRRIAASALHTWLEQQRQSA